jgi:rhamnulokinase
MNMPKFLAFDLGAESGRAVLGHLKDDKLTLEEVHRFPNRPLNVRDTLHWDALGIWRELQTAMDDLGDVEIAGIGLDTWGVDFGLLDSQGTLLGNPVAYRDSRTDGMMERAFETVPRAEVFERTGIQFMQLNSLFQLLAMAEAGSPILETAETFLAMPDLLNYWMTGRAVSEFTIATTTQCYDPRAGDWAREMVEKLGIPARIFPEIVRPGEVLGELQNYAVGDTVAPMAGTPVIAVGCHDTASAVAAVPAAGEKFAYLSSGTWSLMGAEIREPIINDLSLRYNFTNEGGVYGTFRFLKNIMGLWLVQECRRTWAAQGDAYDYGEMTEMAAAAPAFGPLVDPDADDFFAPGDMPSRIAAFCERTGQKVPGTHAEILRCALESMALKYRRTLRQLEEMLGYELDTIHIVGGGSQNTLLNQLAADATGCTVLTGPIEATAAGNVLVQAIATGHLDSLEEGRELVRRSFPIERYEPNPSPEWDAAYERFMEIVES